MLFYLDLLFSLSTLSVSKEPRALTHVAIRFRTFVSLIGDTPSMRTKVTQKTVAKQPSWRLASADVEAFVTEQGGHLGPVTFDRRNRKISPYSVAPWATEKIDPSTPEILKVLRGDFFCLPFGGNESPYKKERHPVHGETANSKWSLQSLNKTADRTCLNLSLRTKIRKGRVDKRITLIDGHNALYCKHVISEMSGPMNLGHHAMLLFPDEPGSGAISTSPIKYGQVFTEPTENPAEGGYCILKPGAEIKSLSRVPTITGETADLSKFPARRGFDDIIQILCDPKAKFAWTAVTFPKQRYVWFALKDPSVLGGTIFWISNGGRYYAPWNGRHINVMGLEEVTSYFAPGLAEAAKKNPFTKKGFKTTLQMSPKRPQTINYIMAVTPIPTGFDQVKRITLAAGKATLVAKSGKRVETPIDTSFLASGV